MCCSSSDFVYLFRWGLTAPRERKMHWAGNSRRSSKVMTRFYFFRWWFCFFFVFFLLLLIFLFFFCFILDFDLWFDFSVSSCFLFLNSLFSSLIVMRCDCFCCVIFQLEELSSGALELSWYNPLARLNILNCTGKNFSDIWELHKRAIVVDSVCQTFEPVDGDSSSSSHFVKEKQRLFCAWQVHKLEKN